MNQTEKRQVRDKILAKLESFECEGFEFYGRTNKGVVLNDGNSNFIVLTAIAKRDSYADEVDLLIEDYEMKQKEEE